MSVHLFRLAAAAPLLALMGALPAHAQDPTPWSGWYVGANAGATWGNSKLGASVAPGNGSTVIPPQDVTLINATGLSDSTKTGFTGGIEGGYNYLAGSWLFGLEGEYTALDVNDRATAQYNSPLLINPPVTYTMTQRAKTNWMFSLRPRIGYVYGDWLFYGTAGIASADLKVKLDFADNRVPPNVVASSESKTKTGYIAGLGAGYALTDNVSLKGEWLYAGFGNVRTSVSSPNGFVNLTSKATVDTNIFRMGIDYRF